MKDFRASRRSVLKVLGGGAGMLAMPYVIRPRPAWAQDKVLNITTYDKFIPPDFVDKFQSDTGITVQIRLTDDQGKQYNLVAAEGGNPTTDIVTVAGHRFSQWVTADLLTAVDTDRIPNWKTLNPAYQNAEWLKINGNVYGLPILAGFEGLARNTEYTKASDSWGIMFDPEYKGLTSYIVSDFLSVTMLYLGDDGDFVTYTDKPEVAQAATNKARDYLIEHKDMVRKYYDAGSEVQQMFINEDIYVGHSWSGPATKLILDGHPIELSVPKEGSYGFIYSLNVVKNAPNEENAFKFLDALLQSPEVGAAMTRASGFNSTFAGVEKVFGESERKALTLPQEQLERLRFFVSDNRDMKNEMIDRATAEVKAA
ncbi:MAG: extracellular solute-binding protein [Rhizobiales bacterium]|nr:extracellular solute-binding protein [Hyphomicrobiales bacterium]